MCVYNVIEVIVNTKSRLWHMLLRILGKSSLQCYGEAVYAKAGT